MRNIAVTASGFFLWSLTRVLNLFFDIYTGGSQRPVFFPARQANPALLELDRNYGEIRRELDAVLADREAIPRYHDLDPLQHEISAVQEPEKRWQVFMLNCMGVRIEKNCVRCPVTAGLVEAVPDLFQAFFSILEGGKSIPPHCGIYRGYLRYHLALRVPKVRPPRIRIKDQIHEWREGESVVFDDSWDHQVHNESNDVRVVLIVDVLRPMPALPRALNRLVKAYLRLHYVRFTLRQPYFQ